MYDNESTNLKLIASRENYSSNVRNLTVPFERGTNLAGNHSDTRSDGRWSRDRGEYETRGVHTGHVTSQLVGDIEPQWWNSWKDCS